MSLKLKPISVPQFLSYLERYYGEQYEEFVAAVMAKYLREFSDSYLAALLHVTIKRYSRRWGKSPDVAVLEEQSAEALRTLEDVESDTLALPESSVSISDEERAETLRLMEQARDTPMGRLLLGVVGTEA